MRGLRFASVDEMPEALRASARVSENREIQAIVPTVRCGVGTAWLRNKTQSGHRGSGAVKPRKPRRDEEHNEQVVFFNRIRALGVNVGGVFAVAARRTHAIPNGGGHTKREAGRLKAEGVTAGVSDVFCALAAGPWHGLYIEMKSNTGVASADQRVWVEESNQLGFLAVVCRGAQEAAVVWESYVRGGST